MAPLDLQRLATRIERLRRTSRMGWHPGDDLEFRNILNRVQGYMPLPDPKRLRKIATQVPMDEDDQRWVSRNWRLWLSCTMRAEGLIRDNDPRNPKRILRDMARGRFP